MVLGLFCTSMVVSVVTGILLEELFETHDLVIHPVIALLLDGTIVKLYYSPFFAGNSLKNPWCTCTVRMHPLSITVRFFGCCCCFCQDDTKFGATTPKPLMHI